MTGVATETQEAVLKLAAFEVIREFLPDIDRQFRALRRQVGLELAREANDVSLRDHHILER